MALTCSINTCESPPRARGWCRKHYQRWAKYGDPNQTAWEKGDDEARFWAKVDRGGPDECWPWLGYRDADGYGHFGVWRDGRKVDLPAHRFAFELLVGPIPDGKHLDHVRARGCTLRACVNAPAHLEPVTPGENIRRGETGQLAGARQLAKTHCPAGHLYDESNTIHCPRGDRTYRRCRACERERKRRKRT